jgi:hypothetical protein
MAERSLTRARPKPPSPPWYGGVATALLALMVVIVLTYTLLDWDWQQSLGAWNYAAVGVLVVVNSVLMRNWRADLARNDGTGGTGGPDTRPAAGRDAGQDAGPDAGHDVEPAD